MSSCKPLFNVKGKIGSYVQKNLYPDTSMNNSYKITGTQVTSESGFALVLSLVVLLMLSLYGAWALQTSNSELSLAGNSQQAETQLNITEGAANREASRLGFNKRSFYQLPDPSNFNRRLVPTTDAEFDPGNDTANLLGGITSGDATTWPWDNLISVRAWDDPNDPANNVNINGAANRFDYRYLVTYLHSDTPPIGYDANFFTGYKFRIQGNTVLSALAVELGGTKIGVKSAL